VIRTFNTTLPADLAVDAYIRRLHLSIDHALAVSYRRNMYDGKSVFVAHITVVKGVPFYGYHVGYKFFLKVYMLNPMHMTRLADILRQGTVMKTFLQPYESHMQYLAQWMCDYNLYGCAYIDCRKVMFRAPVPDKLEMNNSLHQWHDHSISPDMISHSDDFPRQSHCSIEVDACVQDIANRDEIKPRSIHHDFVERTNPLLPDEKLVHSMAGLWRDETRRRKARMGIVDPDSSPFAPEDLISVSADPRSSQRGGWIHEEEYMERVRAIISEEKNKSEGRKVAFQGFVRKAPFESRIKTTLESVEDLYPENLAKISILESKSPRTDMDGKVPEPAEIDVDESRIWKCDVEDFPYESDEDLALNLDLARRKKGDRLDDTTEAQGDLNIAEGASPNFNGGSDAEQARSALTRSEIPAPHSSSELEALGIRNAGDSTHYEEDAFEIPEEYGSDMSRHVARKKRLVEHVSKSESATKRRKINPDEQQSFCENRPANGETHGFGIWSSLHAGRHISGEDHPRVDQLNSLEDPVMNGQNRLNTSIVAAPKLLSREKSKGVDSNGNKTLSFQVVKDPHDPETIKRLSQQSSSPLKDSQSFGEKHVSWSDSVGDTKSISKRSDTVPTSSLERHSEGENLGRQGLDSIYASFRLPPHSRVLCFAQKSPIATQLPAMMKEVKLPSIIYQDAFYSDEQDVPERAREYAGKEFKLGSLTVPYLPDFDPTGTSPVNAGEKYNVVVDRAAEERAFQKRRRVCKLKTWEIMDPPPTRTEVATWLELEQHHRDGMKGTSNVQVDAKDHKAVSNGDLSQIEGPTQKNRHGFKYSQKQASSSVQHETQYMSIMSLEVHINTRGSLIPNPEQDEIACIFWCLQSDDEDLETNGVIEGTHLGILALSEHGGLARKIAQETGVEVEEETTELNLITRMVDILRYHDPDILTGYEVHGGSWGYLIERARFKYDYNLCDEFSRMKSQSHGRFGKDNDKWGFNHTSTIRVTGRHMINIWRAMRGELNLLQYTLENVVFHLLHRRIPHYPYRDLTAWYSSGKPRDLARVVDYYVSKVQLNLQILEQNELVARTSEQARLLGVDFFSVFSRGSQFKVESLMFRIAKPENFLLVSPSRKQVGQQNALECLPLVMEPQSAFYNSPLLVLDFQSLYPSVMIAYNYCYSTFLGRVVNWRGQNKMGFMDFKREQRLLELFKDQINIAPNGIMYVRPELRKSLLAKMLGEILETRVMVKSGMKLDRDDKTLQRLLNNRQLALKLIANVTYGYTSASFSGRMPCSEIADSIVQTGRETLEKAIALIHSVERWGAEVVYGDTDSLFVYLNGRTKEQAFDIGKEIADTITRINPKPVKLKFEKVYLPCVLLAKKRYVGFKYESRDQKEPEFDAKGIETVRRDGTPAEQKIEEKALKILFRTADLSQVKRFFQQQCTKIMKGKVSIQDFCFAKEVKLGTYSDRGLPPPGALISTKRMLEDPRAEPQYGERVPYVVITGAPGARLIDRCVAPEVLLQNDQNELDAEYYISKNLIPPLERIFNLVGANVRQWYDEMPKLQRIRRVESAMLTGTKDEAVSKKTLESYMRSSSCLVCRDKLEAELPICNRCLERADTSLLALRSRLAKAEKKAVHLEKVCRSCAGIAWGEPVKCDSKDCPVFYTRSRHMASLGSTKALIEPVLGVLQEGERNAYDW